MTGGAARNATRKRMQGKMERKISGWGQQEPPRTPKRAQVQHGGDER